MSEEIKIAKKRILIIDPKDGRHGFIIENLENKGFQIIEANNGKQAMGVMLAQLDQLALIIIQTQVADMSPMEIAKFVRNHPNLKDVPIVLSCTYISGAQMEEALAQGINGILATPVRKNQFDRVNQDFDDLLRKLQSKKIDVNVA